jgi:hypothetical protein
MDPISKIIQFPGIFIDNAFVEVAIGIAVLALVGAVARGICVGKKIDLRFWKWHLKIKK